MAGRPPRLVHIPRRRSVFSQVRQNLQCCLPEASSSFICSCLRPPLRLRQDKQPHIAAMLMGLSDVPHVVVPPQKVISCCLVPALSPCISPVWSAVITQMDSENRTHTPEISRAPTNGTSVVDKIATTARMMCLRVLMVGVTPCLDRVVHAIPWLMHFRRFLRVDIFHVGPSHSEDTVERGSVRKKCPTDRVDLVQLGGHEESRESVHSCQRSWRQGTSCAQGLTCQSQIEQGGEQHWKNLETRHFAVGRAE